MSRPRLASTLAALASLACMPPAVLDEQPVTATPTIVEPDTPASGKPLEGQVVVRGNAWLYAAPDSDIRFRLVDQDGPVPLSVAARFAVIAEHGDWIELDAGAEPSPTERTCVRRDEGIFATGVRVFVERGDLVAITTSTVELAFEDGTSLDIRPGTPIGSPREDGWRLIETERARLFAPIPAERIGEAFVDWGPAAVEFSDVEFTERSTLEFAGRERLEFKPFMFMDTAKLIASDDAGSLIELDLDCFTAIVRAAPGSIDQVGAYGFGAGSLGTGRGSPRPQTWYEIAADTPVFWSDGAAAGRRRRPFSTRTPPIERGSLRCFEHWVGNAGLGERRGVELCYEAAAVAVVER